MSKKMKWSYSAGERPYTVVVYEREPGGPLQARVWNPTLSSGKGGWRRKSLGHTDRERAKTYASEQTAALRKGDADLLQGKITLAQVFTQYKQKRTPRKTKTEQGSDARRIEMWVRVLGAGKDPSKVSLGEWEAFIDARMSGSINPRGMAVADENRRPVRARSAEADCDWLRWVFNWASKWRTPQGFYLLRENPVRGYDAPKEKNPLRPVATQDRFEAVRKISDKHTMEVRWQGKREEHRSYLTELLEIVNGTGRRISAVCQLRYDDLRLSEGDFGSIRWPADTDKTGRETIIPIGPRVRQILDRVLRERPGIGPAQLFPSPKAPDKPISRHLADSWLREAERLAELEPQKGSLWHAYRRKWATERKHLPDVDVAMAGGWKETTSLKRAYQQADQATMLSVVLEAKELREAQG